MAQAPVGRAAAIGRVFAFLAPLSCAVLIALFGRDEVVFVIFTAIMVLGGLVALAAGPETRGRDLDAPVIPRSATGAPWPDGVSLP